MSNNKQTRFSLRKGLSSDLPNHAPLGEPLFCTDTKELYIGMGEGIKPQPVTNKEADDKLTTITRLITEFGAVGDGVTDCTSAFKEALKLAYTEGALRLRVPKGDYVMNGYADIYSNTYIEFDKGARIIKSSKAKTSYFLVCGRVESEGTTGYGGGAKNITIDGGTFIGYPNNNIGVSLTLNHAQNCTFKNMEFISAISTGHAFDLAGCDNILIDRCIFRGRQVITDREFTEAIQIDCSTNPSLSNNFSNYDNLPTKNVTVQNCMFLPIYTETGSIKYYAPNPIGSHGFSTGQYYENIKFISNYVENGCEGNSGGWIRFYSSIGVIIKDNLFKSTINSNTRVVAFQTKANADGVVQVCSNSEIINNKFVGFDTKLKQGVNTIYPIVAITGVNYQDTNYYVHNIDIINNKFENCYNEAHDKTTTNGADLIYVNYGEDINITQNSLLEGRRLAYVTNSNKIRVTRNNIKNCYYVGLSLLDVTNLYIDYNTFDGVACAVYARNINHPNISNNTIINSLNTLVGTFNYILALRDCTNLIVSSNIIINTNGQDGFGQVIHIFNSATKNGVVSSNIIKGYTKNITYPVRDDIIVDEITKTAFN